MLSRKCLTIFIANMVMHVFAVHLWQEKQALNLAIKRTLVDMINGHVAHVNFVVSYVESVTILLWMMCGYTEGLQKLQQQAIPCDLVSDADVGCMTTPQKLQWLNVWINANAWSLNSIIVTNFMRLVAWCREHNVDIVNKWRFCIQRNSKFILSLAKYMV